jgi:hypothetical protein
MGETPCRLRYPQGLCKCLGLLYTRLIVFRDIFEGPGYPAKVPTHLAQSTFGHHCHSYIYSTIGQTPLELYTKEQVNMGKPIVLHLGEPIKYNHDFYSNDFLSRFDVVRNEEPDRESFIKALQSNKYVAPLPLFYTESQHT